GRNQMRRRSGAGNSRSPSLYPVRAWKDGQEWRIGLDSDVEWISEVTTTGLTITSAIPPVFDAYATIVVPDDRDARSANALVILGVLAEQSAHQPWWLGYLDTGSDDVVFPNAPRVNLYACWRYVLVQAGYDEAIGWRRHDAWPRGPGPDLLFPADRSWLLSRLWDDDWRCFGGPSDLVDRLLGNRQLDVRRVELSEDATPPGHTAY
ncbi:MAG TPA: hypothetical protein VFV02_10520, partial [Acidimicrobiales bacterium]|nr:hypothetical protein [Acidimicrobiales bacterium]